ncbi:B3 domain-containing protein Os04g0386900-like [Impatiens glandulifera]|uniref:B3 domain-containing protein Os04g0386900-like n=1 Tax=Impatiens glandulifera TaxID=253017 RepID=UPI001FB0A552|nr:B3 domain-containing protein Os04g0386900-like [Impatiens glandulifera]
MDQGARNALVSDDRNEIEYPVDGPHWPLSGKPYFHTVLEKSHVRPVCLMGLPVKMQKHLPFASIPIVLTYCGKLWEVMYLGDYTFRRFDAKWKKYVEDNDLKVGDAVVFELDESRNGCTRFRTQILRGDYPARIMNNRNGETSETSIVIDED